MRFNSFIFLAFLPLVCIVLWLLPARWRRWWLLLASYAFYASWHWPYLALLLSVAALNHFGARWIIGAENRSRRGAVVLAANIGLLAVFKYLDWLVGNVNFVARLFGSHFQLPIPALILPLGISFYLFEAISYTVDVIRKRERLHGFWDFQLFIAFFPKLIAGPILRAKEFLPQIERGNLRPTLVQIREALWLLASGLFLKLVLANMLGPQIDEAFSRSVKSVGPTDAWLMGIAFGLQIYFDFSSYTRMALGSAKLCGIQLVENFNYPYSAANPVDFWNRWHMSLSRWIRDYLFFPLAGNRPTLASMLKAAVIAMTLCGLWHGAGWTFVLWGLYHGLLICGTHLIRFEREPKDPASQPVLQPTTTQRMRRLATRPLAIVGTFALVSFGWILFRANTISQAFELMLTAVQPWRSHAKAFGGTFYAETIGLVILVWFAPHAARLWDKLSALAELPKALPKRPIPAGVPIEPPVAVAAAAPAGSPTILPKAYAATVHGSGANPTATSAVPTGKLAWNLVIGSLEGLAIGAMLVCCLVFFYGGTQFIYFQF
jgi:alginate O-acetyltransferase complex protein AlgI